MNPYRTQPPWDFLLTASPNSLHSYELSRLAHAANLRKEIAQLLDSWVEENSAAMLARWLMENRERGAKIERAANTEVRATRATTASDNVLADCETGFPESRARC